MYLHTHGHSSNFREPVPRFAPKPQVVAALKKMDPELDVVFLERFGGRLAIVQRMAYTPMADRSELPDFVVMMIMTRDDGGPRQIEMSDVHRMRQSRLETWDGRLKEMRENNAEKDEAMERKFLSMEQDFFTDWESTRVWDRRSVRNGSSNQYICEHGFRNVKCPLCRPNKKMVFRMGVKSGAAHDGHDSVDLRDHPDLLAVLKEKTETLRVMNERKAKRDALLRGGS